MGYLGAYKWADSPTYSGAFSQSSITTNKTMNNGTTIGHAVYDFNASNSNPTYGSSDTVTPLSESCKYIISY